MSELTIVSRTQLGSLEFDDRFADAQRTLRAGDVTHKLPSPGYWKAFLQGNPCEEFFLALVDSRVVGRVGASRSPTRPETGYVGFFEVDVQSPDHKAISRALLEAACAFLRSLGVSKAVGPLDTSTWFSYRFGVEQIEGEGGFQEDEFAWEPFQPASYPALWEASGFSAIEEYRTRGQKSAEPGVSFVASLAEQLRPAYEYALGTGVTFRPFKPPSCYAEELPMLYKIASEGFARNAYFEPISYERFYTIFAGLPGRCDYHGISFFVVSGDGRDVGFMIAWIERGYVVLKSATLLEELRGKNLTYGLGQVVLAAAAARGVDKLLNALYRIPSASMALEDNTIGRAVHWTHSYALFARELK